MKLHPESSRESHFEATVTRFESPWRIGRKSEMKQVGIPRGEPGRQGRSPGFTKLSQDRTETRIKLKVARGQVARFPEKRLDLPQSHETKGRPRPRSLEGGGQNASLASRAQEICPGSNGNSKKTGGPGWTIWEAQVVFFRPAPGGP